MDKREDCLTVLTCHGKGKKATKKFNMKEDGTIQKISFKAGMDFAYESMPFSGLKELGHLVDELSDDPRKFIIRGQIKDNMPEIVKRRIHGSEAAFDSVPRSYVMLDIDKLECPAFFHPAQNPEQAVKWALETLPDPFRGADCYYRFSSSQNVPYGELRDKNVLSIHLWFLCDRPVSDDEWKRYFKRVSSPVDSALFSAVQPHFIAQPIFEGMEDPLPKRSGFFKGKCDVVPVPEIPKLEEKKRVQRQKVEPTVSEENRNTALELIRSYNREGSRNRLAGAIAATLCRGGWKAENAASFVYELAELCSDEEAHERYNNALRICDAVDSGLPAQGIPTLKEEFKIGDIEKILELLGLGKPDMVSLISGLSNQSSVEDIKEVLHALLLFPCAEQDFHLDKLAKQTSAKKGTLKSLLKEVSFEQAQIGPRDLADCLMESLLKVAYEDGQHLLYTHDKLYWQYNGRFWEKIPEQQIKRALLPLAREFIAEIEKGTVPSFNNAVINILEGRVYRENDPLRQLNYDPPSVINCRNGELWIDENGDVTLKPHRSESYLRSCLNVDYDPAATSPMFDKAVLEIFSNSSEPEDMFRHFMEFAGYTVQPWRKLAVIFLLHGGGSNGKTSLVNILRKTLGENTVMSDRISDIETNVFKVGDLDGKLMLLDDDVDGGTCIPDGFLKKISEEKALTGQHKHKPPFEFTCRAVPVMLANDYPVSRDLSLGIRRRLQVIPFNQTFVGKKMKPGLFDDIWREEASGILNHIVAGFQRLKKRGKFKEPEDCKIAKQEWIVRANILTTFIDEACEVGEGYREHLGDFYTAFNEYCREAGARNIQGRRGFESRLEGLGYRVGMLDGKKAVWGIRLSPSDFELVKEKSEPNL